MTNQIILLTAALTICVELSAMGSKNDQAARTTTEKSTSVSAAAIMEDSTTKTESDSKTTTESLPGSIGKKPTTPNTSAEGVGERKGQTDPSGPHSYIGSRARGKALQTDKFPRPAKMTASGTTQPKSKY